MQDNEIGLRERQRVDTLRRLHDAAIDLVREEGFTAATVSAIADRAGVSRRTFFNYYATKEDAVLGAGPACVPDDGLDGLLEGPDQLERVVHLVLRVARSARRVRTQPAERKALIDAHPELRLRSQHHAVTSQDLLARALAERYDGDDAERVTALVMIATSVMRFAYSHDINVIDDPDSPAVADAVAMFHTIFKDIT